MKSHNWYVVNYKLPKLGRRKKVRFWVPCANIIYSLSAPRPLLKVLMNTCWRAIYINSSTVLWYLGLGLGSSKKETGAYGGKHAYATKVHTQASVCLECSCITKNPSVLGCIQRCICKECRGLPKSAQGTRMYSDAMPRSWRRAGKCGGAGHDETLESLGIF